MASAWITGLSADDARLSWTVLHRSKEDWTVADQGAIPFHSPPDAPQPPTTADIKTAARHLRGPLTLAIPTRCVILHTALLPSSNPDELQNMASLQIDRFSPYPVEQLVLSIETLRVRENSAFVAMAAIRREEIDEISRPFQTARLPPDTIDLAPLAWWRLLQDASFVPSHAPRLYLLLLPSHTDFILSREGLPLLFLSFPPCPPTSENYPAWTTDLTEEITSALTTAEADWGPLGAPSALLFADPPATPAAQALLHALQCASPLPSAMIHPLSASLPPLAEGIARRAATPAAPLALDLAPQAWHAADAKRRLRRSLLRTAAAFLLLWSAALLAFFLLLQLERAKLADLRTRVDALEKPSLDVRHMLAKLNEWNLYADRSHSALEILRTVALAMPPHMELSSFIYRKGATLSLRGESDKPDPVYAFIKNLEASTLFTHVRNEGLATRSTPSGTVNPFGVTASLPHTAPDEKEKSAP